MSPMLRKVIKIGSDSRGVILPSSWIKYEEEKAGVRMTHVAMEVLENPTRIVIEPFFLKGGKK